MTYRAEPEIFQAIVVNIMVLCFRLVPLYQIHPHRKKRYITGFVYMVYGGNTGRYSYGGRICVRIWLDTGRLMYVIIVQYCVPDRSVNSIITTYLVHSVYGIEERFESWVSFMHILNAYEHLYYECLTKIRAWISIYHHNFLRSVITH